MKSTIILLALMLAFSSAFAQKGKVTAAQTFKETGDLKKALEKQVQKEPQDVVRDIPPDDWDNLVGTASLLRSSLAKDIGARRKPAIKDS